MEDIVKRRNFVSGAAALAAASASAGAIGTAVAATIKPYSWDLNPPTDTRENFIAWGKARGEDAGFLGQRWDRFQAEKFEGPVVLTDYRLWSPCVSRCKIAWLVESPDIAPELYARMRRDYSSFRRVITFHRDLLGGFDADHGMGLHLPHASRGTEFHPIALNDAGAFEAFQPALDGRARQPEPPADFRRRQPCVFAQQRKQNVIRHSFRHFV